ncbi:response regulator transcription factor [Clostridium tagluense]|uniref:response regulator transcription factor n=1 Tax=Clostridium tagluense TaxID=360422 RepID=UPI001C0CFB5D|nr:response regulator transcription factor [Clostridium tagluense]MBU3126142.1 response regulator transcription factor [Clostridium tagluense]
MREKILIVDDEEDIVSFIKDYLEDEGYEVYTANNGREALLASTKALDLILLDIMMPDFDGFEVCKKIREDVSCPIIFLSARQSESDRIKGLGVGADDYIVKPFSIKELKARIEAHLRREKRVPVNNKAKISFEKLTLDLSAHKVYYGEEIILLTAREFGIVEFLALHSGQVFSKEQIYEKVWGYDAEGDSSTVAEHVKKIRAKLIKVDAQLNHISTVWGVGYRWERCK